MYRPLFLPELQLECCFLSCKSLWMESLHEQYSSVRSAQTCIIQGKLDNHLHHKCNAQHRSVSSSGPDSAVHVQIKNNGHSFEDCNVHILEREDKWFGGEEWKNLWLRGEKPILNTNMQYNTYATTKTKGCGDVWVTTVTHAVETSHSNSSTFSCAI